MKSERLLDALNDLDDCFIKEAREEKNVHVQIRCRRMTALLAAIIALIALSVTAFASESISGWFRNFFEERTDSGLTQEQIGFIEENEQVIEESQVQNNCTVELKSFMTDGQYVCMLLGVTAPEGMKIENASIGNFTGYPGFLTPEADWTHSASGQTMILEDDGDGKDNTVNIFVEAMYEFDETEKPFDYGSVWNLKIQDFTASCVNEEYLAQLDMENGAVALSGEELAQAYQVLTLAEGTWEYQFTVEEGDFREVAIQLDKPIVARTIVGKTVLGKDRYEDYWEDVTITSITLRSMGMTINCAQYPKFTYHETCTVVMKDGSSIELTNYWSKHYSSRTPIVIEEVDHILLADGTKIPMPE